MALSLKSKRSQALEYWAEFLTEAGVSFTKNKKEIVAAETRKFGQIVSKEVKLVIAKSRIANMPASGSVFGPDMDEELIHIEPKIALGEFINRRQFLKEMN